MRGNATQAGINPATRRRGNKPPRRHAPLAATFRDKPRKSSLFWRQAKQLENSRGNEPQSKRNRGTSAEFLSMRQPRCVREASSSRTSTRRRSTTGFQRLPRGWIRWCPEFSLATLRSRHRPISSMTGEELFKRTRRRSKRRRRRRRRRSRWGGTKEDDARAGSRKAK